MRDPVLRIALHLSGPMPTLRLAGELDHCSGIDLTDDLACVAEAGFTAVDLDMAEVCFMDCGGLRALAAADRIGLTIRLRNVTPQVRLVLDHSASAVAAA